MPNYDEYLAMQKEFYERDIPSELIIGGFEWNQAFPYETHLLYRHGDVRYPIFENPSEVIAFDFGCGPGRMVTRMNRLFKRCDGGDISSRLIEEARQKCPESKFWVTGGDDVGDVPDSTYDFVFSTIAMQHIASRSVKLSILKHLCRIMKPGACLTIQLAFNRHFPYAKLVGESAIDRDHKVVLYERMPNHRHWREDFIEAKATNSSNDGAIGAGDMPDVLEDFGKYFADLEFWFYDHTHFRREPQHLGKHGNWNSHFLFVHGRKPVA